MKRIANKFLRCISFVCSLLLMFSVLSGCENKPQKTVTISEDLIELTIDESFSLTATVSDGSKAIWSSSNSDVASISETGVVTAVSVGESVITATSGDIRDECTVIVTAAAQEQIKGVTSFSGGIPVNEMFLGDSINIKPTLKINGETKTENVVVTYNVSNENVLSLESGVVTALALGECEVTATCEYSGKTYTDKVTVNVVAVAAPITLLADSDGNAYKNAIAYIDEISIQNQMTVKYYTETGIHVCSIEYSATNDGESEFNIMNVENAVGVLKLSLTNSENQSILKEGVVKANLKNNVSQNIKMAYSISMNNVDQVVTEYKAYVKAKNVYTDFVECNKTEDVLEYVSYDFPSGGAIELCNTVTYNGLSSLKLTVPRNRSYFRLSDLIENSDKYGLTVGSKISFKIRYDGEPKVDGTYYYAIGKIISENGESKVPSAGGVLSYADATALITSGSSEWFDVSYVLDESSFPLVDLGLQISGNSGSDERYVYIAAIMVENPDGVDYTINFANAVQWDNTGRNSMAAWWGYSGNVAKAFSQASVPAEIASSYKSTYGTELKGKVPVASPIMATLQSEEIQKPNGERFVLQNSSCSLSNAMKAIIYNGNTKIRVRFYMQVEGSLPKNASANVLVFVRKGSTAGYGFSEGKLQTLQPNTWSELTYDVPNEYLEADLLTVAFNLKNYLYCNSDVNINFYLGSIAFVSE